MTITALNMRDFRNLRQANLTLGPRLNVLHGQNGSGKTSVLEAIYYLSAGRSFRSNHAQQLIHHTAPQFAIHAQVFAASRHIPLGISRNQDGATQIRVAEEDVASISKLAALVPLRLINSQSHLLLESGPQYRRKFLDWGLFYGYQPFFQLWRQYERVLKQRNLLLKTRAPRSEIAVWTQELIKHAKELHNARLDYIAALTPILVTVAQSLLDLPDLDIAYQPGWQEDLDLDAVFADKVFEELRAGFTLYGPHRADFDIVQKNISTKHFLSRGQQKLLICAMIVAQGMLLNNQADKQVIYLVDDLPSELDSDSKSKLLTLLQAQPTQVFITAIDGEDLQQLLSNITQLDAALVKMFHVERGKINDG